MRQRGCRRADATRRVCSLRQLRHTYAHHTSPRPRAQPRHDLCATQGCEPLSRPSPTLTVRSSRLGLAMRGCPRHRLACPWCSSCHETAAPTLPSRRFGTRRTRSGPRSSESTILAPAACFNVPLKNSYKMEKRQERGRELWCGRMYTVAAAHRPAMVGFRFLATAASLLPLP
jgi:hypothetical protein